MGDSVSKPVQLCLVLAAWVVILAGMKAAESIITPLILAVFIAAISSPSYFWLLRKRVPVGLALTLVIATVVLAGIVLSALISQSLSGFSAQVPLYQQRLAEVWVGVLKLVAASGLPIDTDPLGAKADVPAVMGFVAKALNRLVSVFTGTFFILLALVFMLMEMSLLPRKIVAISAQPEQSLRKLNYFLATLNQYFAMKTLISMATGLLVYIGLVLLAIDYPVLWALLAFLLNFIPTVGSLVAAVPAILMALIQYGFGAAAWVALLYLLINNIVGGLIEPRLMGQRLGLSVLVVFVSLVVWGWLLGPVGMFLSVPLTVTAKIALESNPSTAWLGIALGNASELEPPAPQ